MKSVTMARYIINSVDHQISFPTPPLTQNDQCFRAFLYSVQIKGWLSYKTDCELSLFGSKIVETIFKIANVQRRNCGSQIPRASETIRNLWDSNYTWSRVQKPTLDYIGWGVDIIAPLCEQLRNDLLLNWHRNQSKQ